MGNYKFRLSDMMPNSWFYKLKDMGRATTRNPQTNIHSKRILNHPKTTTTTTTTTTTKQSNSFSSSNQFSQPKQAYIPNRPSYYYSSRDRISTSPSNSPAHPKASDTHFPIDPPKKSYKKTRKRPTNPSPIALSSVSNCVHHLHSSSAQNPVKQFDDSLSVHRLPPILTKPVKKEDAKSEFDSRHVMLRRAQQGLHRIKVKQSSPKIEVKRVQANRRQKMASSKRLAESFVVVKKSADPKRDFRESMVEMIIENDIRASKDWEELLACYLTLNSDEYHGLIVKVFKEIWVDLKGVTV